MSDNDQTSDAEWLDNLRRRVAAKGDQDRVFVVPIDEVRRLLGLYDDALIALDNVRTDLDHVSTSLSEARATLGLTDNARIEGS